MSGRVASADQATDPTSSLYGMFCMSAVWRGVDGD